MSRFCRFYTFAVFAFWAVLALWMACSMQRIVVFVLLALMALPLVVSRRARMAARNFICAAARRWGVSLTVIILVGLAMRFYLLYEYPEELVMTTSPEYHFVDGAILWKDACQIASGVFPDTKSWTSAVLYGFVHFLLESYSAATVFSVILQMLTCLLLFCIGCRVKNVVCGLVLCAAFYLAQGVSTYAFYVATENVFVFFSSLSILCLVSFVKNGNCRHPFLLCALGGIFAWLATWSRGEGGILLWCTFAGTVVLWYGVQRKDLRGLVKALSVLGLVFACGVGVAYGVHDKIGTPRTILSSSDNLWPRLFGANVQSGGCCTLDEKREILVRYLKDHPECNWEGIDERWRRGRFEGDTEVPQPKCLNNRCPKELIPYIQEEIAARWGALSFTEKVMFVLRKERVWSMDLGEPFSRTRLLYLFYKLYNRVTPVLFSFGTLLFIALLARRRIRLEFRDVLVLSIPFLLMAGMAAVFVFTEVSSRYTYVAYVFGSLPFAWLVGSLADKTRSETSELCNSENAIRICTGASECG
jgi:hypothetical protein